MTMNAEQQYIDLFSQTEAMICKHSAEVLNAPRAAAFADFERIGFPTSKMEKYKYTDVSKYFEPDFGLNLNRLAIPVNPYEVFKCDVPNMSTALYFVVNDAFYNKALPKTHLPEGVIFGSLKEVAEQYPELVKKYYGKLADTSKDGVTAFNTTFAQDGAIFYVPKNVVVEKPIQLVNILRADVNFMVNRRVLIILRWKDVKKTLFSKCRKSCVSIFVRFLPERMWYSICMSWKRRIPARCVSATCM